MELGEKKRYGNFTNNSNNDVRIPGWSRREPIDPVMKSSPLSSAKWQGKNVHLLIFSFLRRRQMPKVGHMVWITLCNCRYWVLFWERTRTGLILHQLLRAAPTISQLLCCVTLPCLPPPEPRSLFLMWELLCPSLPGMSDFSSSLLMNQA